MNKRKIRQLLSLYIDNELSYEEKLRVESNIQEFDEWRQEYNAFRALQDALDSLPRISTNQNFLKDLHSEIQKYEANQSRRIIAFPALIKFAAAAVIVLALAITYKICIPDRATQIYTHSLEKDTAEKPITEGMEQEKEIHTEHASVSEPTEPVHSVSATATQAPQDFSDEMIVLFEPNTSAPNMANANMGTSIPYTKVIHPGGSVDFVYNPAGISSVKFPSDPEKYRTTFSAIEKTLKFYNGYIILEDTPSQPIIKARIPSDTLRSFIAQLNETGKATSVLSPKIDINNIAAIDADNDSYITLKIFLDLNR